MKKSEIFTELDKPHISGITFTGGDPLYQSNINGVETLAKEIKEKYPDKTIWLYNRIQLGRHKRLDGYKIHRYTY